MKDRAVGIKCNDSCILTAKASGVLNNRHDIRQYLLQNLTF